MRPEWKPAIKEAIVWERAISYTDHGCHITGHLIIARCTPAFDAHPRSGEFGSCSCLDVVDLAREVLEEHGIRCSGTDRHKVKLGIPDLVVAVSEEEWESFSLGTLTRTICKIGHKV
jgi:hypothetical protein